MALYQPTNITPSVFYADIGLGAVSLSSDVNITWQVNGTSAMTAFQIDIVSPNDNTVFYSTGKVSAGYGLPFYGTDYQGNIVPFVYAPENTTWQGIDTEGYLSEGSAARLKITQYWMNNIVERSVVSLSPALFRFISAPSVALDTVAYVLSPSETFTASVSASVVDSIRSIQWVLTDTTLQQTVSDTGEIITGVAMYSYSAFITGHNYTLSCTVRTNAGLSATDSISFPVSYTVGGDANLVAVNCTPLGAIRVQWAPIYYIEPTFYGIVNYGQDAQGEYYAELDAGARLSWNDLNINASYTMVYCLDIPETDNNLLVVGGNNAQEIAIKQEQGFIKTSVNGETVGEIATNTIYSTDGKIWLIIQNNTISLCYLAVGTGQWKRIVIATVPQADITSLTVLGAQKINFLFVSKNSAYKIQNANNYIPEFDYDTVFYASFQNALFGHIATSSSQPNTPVTVWRFNQNEAVYLGTYSASAGFVDDYSAKNGVEYTYSVAYNNFSYYASPTASRPICIRLNAYSLIEAQTADSPTANANSPMTAVNVWNFGNNIESGGISNNNSPTLQENFTPYPWRNSSTAFYKTGTLAALLSNAVNGKYADTTEQMKRLYKISLSQNVFFLRDIKGNLYMVHTQSPITQTISENTPQKAVTISLPWVEIGSANNIALTSTAELTED